MLIAVILMIPAAGYADSQGGGERRSEHKRIMEDLNLNKDQIEAMRAIRLETRKKMVKVKSDAELKRIEFQEELQKEKPDKAKLDKLIGEIADLSAQRTRVMMETQVKTVEMLTPEQKEKMMERMSSAMMSGRGGRWNGEHKNGGRR